MVLHIALFPTSVNKHGLVTHNQCPFRNNKIWSFHDVVWKSLRIIYLQNSQSLELFHFCVFCPKNHLLSHSFFETTDIWISQTRYICQNYKMFANHQRFVSWHWAFTLSIRICLVIQFATGTTNPQPSGFMFKNFVGVTATVANDVIVTHDVTKNVCAIQCAVEAKCICFDYVTESLKCNLIFIYDDGSMKPKRFPLEGQYFSKIKWILI